MKFSIRGWGVYPISITFLEGKNIVFKTMKKYKRCLKALAKADYVIANSKFTKELALKFGVKIKLQRIFENYVYNYYLPSILIVSASSLSFIIPLSAMPGRVGLVVTLFLTLRVHYVHHIIIFYEEKHIFPLRLNFFHLFV